MGKGARSSSPGRLTHLHLYSVLLTPFQSGVEDRVQRVFVKLDPKVFLFVFMCVCLVCDKLGDNLLGSLVAGISTC